MPTAPSLGRLAYLICFNPTLTSQLAPPSGEPDPNAIDPDDLEEYAQVLAYCQLTAKESSEGGSRAVSTGRDDVLLRRLGLAKGLMGLTDMVTIKPNHGDGASNVWRPDDTGDRDFVIVHSTKKRLVSFRMERDFWLHLAIDLSEEAVPSQAQTPHIASLSMFSSRTKPKQGSASPAPKHPQQRSADSTRLAGIQERNREGRLLDEWIKTSLRRSWEEWKLLNGPASLLLEQDRALLEQKLKGYWSEFAVRWNRSLETPLSLHEWLGGFQSSPNSKITGTPQWQAMETGSPPGQRALLLGQDGPIATTSPFLSPSDRTLVRFLHRQLLSCLASTKASQKIVKPEDHDQGRSPDLSRRTSTDSHRWKIGSIMDVEWKPILTLGFASGRSGDNSRTGSPAPGDAGRGVHQSKDVHGTAPSVPVHEEIRKMPSVSQTIKRRESQTASDELAVSSSPSKRPTGFSSSLRSSLGQVGNGLAAGVSPVTNGVGRVFSGIGLAGTGNDPGLAQSPPTETIAEAASNESTEISNPIAVKPSTLEDVDMTGLHDALDEAIDSAVVFSGEEPAHGDPGSNDTQREHLQWDKSRIWREEDDTWVEVIWTTRHGRLFALTGTSTAKDIHDEIPQTVVSQILDAFDVDIRSDTGGKHANTKMSAKTGVPKYLFHDGASDRLVVTDVWEEEAGDANVVAGGTDLRNLLFAYTDIFEASARTTNNKWILGKTGDPKKPPSETANEVYLTVDRKDASLVDADYDLRFFIKTHPEFSASAAS